MSKLALDRLVLHTAMMLNRGVSSPEPVVRDSRDSGLFPSRLQHIFSPIRRDQTGSVAGREDKRFRIVASRDHEGLPRVPRSRARSMAASDRRQAAR